MDSTIPIPSPSRDGKLRTVADWNEWYAMAKERARSLNIWEWCNPDTPLDQVPEYKTAPIAEDMPGDEATAEIKNRYWLVEMAVYKLENAAFEKWAEALFDMSHYISITVDPIHFPAIKAHSELHMKFRALKAIFGNQTAYKQDLRSKWHQTTSKEPTTKDIIGWTEQWMALYNQMSSAGMAISDEEAIFLFMNAAYSINPMWWNCMNIRITLDDRKDNIQDVVTSFRRSYDQILIHDVNPSNTPNKGVSRPSKGNRKRNKQNEPLVSF